MNSQKKISSFFTTKTLPVKRPALSGIDNVEPSSKKLNEDNSVIKKSNITVQKTLTTSYLTSPTNKKLMQGSWRTALHAETKKPYYQKLLSFIERERSQHTIYPPEDHVFSWTHHCNISDVKVVILGQDPYHGPNQAHGLCFSVQKGVYPPPSLLNIYKELENSVPGFKHPGHGDLSGWAKQGVLLLNAVLTVRKGEANSHKGQGWENFTDAVISWLNINLKDVVFMLWGSYAQKKGAKISTERHHVLKSVHPSPLSAYRGFIGCGHFSKANDLLIKDGKQPVNWSAL